MTETPVVEVVPVDDWTPIHFISRSGSVESIRPVDIRTLQSQSDTAVNLRYQIERVADLLREAMSSGDTEVEIDEVASLLDITLAREVTAEVTVSFTITLTATPGADIDDFLGDLTFSLDNGYYTEGIDDVEIYDTSIDSTDWRESR